jgi:hypothetical protein
LAVENGIVVVTPLHIAWFAGWLTCPVGLTVMVNVFEGPGHPVPPKLKTGVTIMVPVMGAVVLFVAVKVISPEPLPPIPIAVLLLVHKKVVVPTSLTVLKRTSTGLPLHTTLLSG